MTLSFIDQWSSVFKASHGPGDGRHQDNILSGKKTPPRLFLHIIRVLQTLAEPSSMSPPVSTLEFMSCYNVCSGRLELLGHIQESGTKDVDELKRCNGVISIYNY